MIGTADFLNENGIYATQLEALDDVDHNPDYSLTQHLSTSMIDLYINLPSRNKYRRPASYMSKGYRTRRMAVDLSIPLITNIKCAKVFVEALTRVFELSQFYFQAANLEISEIDSQVIILHY